MGYRANSLCLSSDLADNTYADLPSSENNAWLYCDYGKILSGESTNKDLYGDYLDKLRALYDPNSDGYVSDTEARNGLTSVGCFGPDCPFGNDPDQVTYQLGLGVSRRASRASCCCSHKHSLVDAARALVL